MATERSLADYILDFSCHSGEERQYALTHIGRLVRTLELTPAGGSTDRILEMGAYMQITPALKTVLGYGEVRGAYLGSLGTHHNKTVISQSGETFSCAIDLFNAEKDVYPYADGEFNAVICCEVFEHLSEDPMFLLSEVNRILVRGGHLVLSTPNTCSLRGVAAILTGNHPGLYQQFLRPREGPADPRHAREYTPGEIRSAVEDAGFTVELLETGPYGTEQAGFDWVIDLLRAHGLPTDLRGDTIHVVARKSGGIGERYPKWLYD